LDTAENKLKQEQEAIDKSLHRQKEDFKNSLSETAQKVDQFKEHHQQRDAEKFNNTIEGIIRDLQTFTETKNSINEQEINLELNPTEYPEIEELKQRIRPYQQLWALQADSDRRLS